MSRPLGSDDLAFVVIGGYEYSPAMNQPATAMVRELARRYRVLNLISEARGSVLRYRRVQHLSTGEIARTILGSTRPRRVEERLWIAPVRGLSAIGPLSVPERMRRRNVRVFADVIRRWMHETAVERCVLWFYWWALPELVHAVPNVASIYDCIDEHLAIPQSMVSSTVIERLEGRLLDAVDRSYVVSPALLERQTRPGRQISVLPNGFDLGFFRDLQRQGLEVPPRLRSLPRPIIGYAGGLTSRMDWELVAELTRRRPDWSFVFVGGHPSAVPPALRDRANITFHETIPYPQALGAISCFDVGTIPARVGAFSRGNSFLKLLDYFAHGIPVVAPPLPDTNRVADHGPGLLRLATGADAWEAALAAALEEPATSPARDARRAYVQQRSVEQRATRMVNETLASITS